MLEQILENVSEWRQGKQRMNKEGATRHRQEGTAERQALDVNVFGQVVQVRQAKEQGHRCHSAACAGALRNRL